MAGTEITMTRLPNQNIAMPDLIASKADITTVIQFQTKAKQPSEQRVKIRKQCLDSVMHAR